MSDLRYDPINDQWIAIARNRRTRPMEFIPLEQTQQQIICPFCHGNEDETPTALAAYRRDGSRLDGDDDPSDWSTRVVPNKYPSFSSKDSEAMIDVPHGDATNSNPFPSCQSPGVQELIIPSPRHITSISELTEAELKLSFRVYKDRINQLRTREYIRHAMLFMNCRSAAGASLGHIHSQLIGSPVVSPHLAGRVERFKQHRSEHGCSLLESLVQWEIQSQVRIVALTDNFCVVCPFASRFAFQVWIVPRRPQADFSDCDDDVRDELALHCQSVVTSLENLLEHPSYNLLLNIEPFGSPAIGSPAIGSPAIGSPAIGSPVNSRDDSAGSRSKISDGCDSLSATRWYVEIFPRVARAAGFELGTDIWVNSVAPETAARGLRG